MKKADLLANKPPGRLNDKNVIGNLFCVGKEPVIEMRWLRDGDLIRHFTWKDHWLTYREKTKFAPAHWTQERLSYWGYDGRIYVEDRKKSQRLETDIDEFLKAIGKSFIYDKIRQYEECVAEEKRQAAVKRREDKTTKMVRALTPALPKDFRKWCLNQKAGFVYLYQMTHNHLTIDRRFEVNHERNTITEVSRGWSYAPGQFWDGWAYGIYFDRIGRHQRFDKKKQSYTITKKGVIYPGTLREINFINESARQALLAEAATGDLICWDWYMDKLQRDSRAERVVKSGYKELVKMFRKNCGFTMEPVNERDGVHEMLGVSKGRYRLLRKLNGDEGLIFAASRYALDRPVFTDQELMEIKKIPGVERKKRICHISARYKLKVSHLIKLLRTESIDTISKYGDYLDMAREHGEDIHEEIVYRNKRWKEYHDRWNAEQKAKKEQKRKTQKNKEFKNIARDKKRNQDHFGWESKSYVMLIPTKAGDIIDEGNLQHHCVGASDNYMEQMHNRKSFILFLRKKEDAQTPYYTIQATWDGKVMQAYSKYNRKPDWEIVNKALNAWKREIKKRFAKECEKVTQKEENIA